MKNVSFVTFLFVSYLILVSSSSKLKSKKLKTHKKQTQQTTILKTNQEEEEKHPNYARAYFQNKDCDEDNCFNGRCNKDKSICYCNDNFANYPSSGNKERFCVYKRKSQLAGFLLEFILGFGIGHLAVGRIAMGYAK